MIPCQPDCPERHPKCHADCQHYLKYKENMEREKKKRHSEVSVIVYQIDQCNKAMRDKHAKKLFKRRVHHK